MITLKYFPENDCKSRILSLKFGNTQTTAFVMTLTYFLLRSHNDYSPITFQLSYQEERIGGKLQVHKVFMAYICYCQELPTVLYKSRDSCDCRAVHHQYN